MLRRLVAARTRNGYNKGDVVLWRDWHVWAIEDNRDNEAVTRLRQLPGDFVVIELDKFNAKVDAYSIGELKRAAAAQTECTEPLPTGFRPLLSGDLSA